MKRLVPLNVLALFVIAGSGISQLPNIPPRPQPIPGQFDLLLQPSDRQFLVSSTDPDVEVTFNMVWITSPENVSVHRDLVTPYEFETYYEDIVVVFQDVNHTGLLRIVLFGEGSRVGTEGRDVAVFRDLGSRPTVWDL